MVTFGSHLTNAVPLVPLSRNLSCLDEVSFKLISLLCHRDLVPVFLFPFYHCFYPSFQHFLIHSCFKLSFFLLLPFSSHYFSLSFFLCLFSCHFLLPCIKHALYLYLSSRSIPVCVLPPTPRPSSFLVVSFPLTVFDLFFMLALPLRACWYLSSTSVYFFCLL